MLQRVKNNLDPEVSEENIAMAVAIPIESDVDQRGLDEMISSVIKKKREHDLKWEVGRW